MSEPAHERDRSRVVARPFDAHVEAAAGSASPSRSGHSTAVTPSRWRSSIRPPASASSAPASRYGSMWKSGSRPSYSAMRMKLGEVIGLGHAEPGPERLREMGLARPELAPQAHEVARRAPRAPSGPAEDGCVGVGVGGHDERTGIGRAGAGSLGDVRRTARGRPSGHGDRPTRRRSGPRRPRGGRRRRTGAVRRDRPTSPRARRAGRPGRGRGRAGAPAVDSRASKTSIGGSPTIATSRPARASSTSMTGLGDGPADGALEHEDGDTAAADGAPRAGVAPRRGSRAAPCSARPPTMMPRTPIARARVSVSASMREPTTRIVPASPTSRPPRAQLPVDRRRRRGGARGSGHRAPRSPCSARPRRPDHDRGAGPDLADDAGDRAVERFGDLAAGDPPAAAPARTAARPRRCARPAGFGDCRARPGRSAAASRTRSTIGAPGTTDSPAATSARSPGASGT